MNLFELKMETKILSQEFEFVNLKTENKDLKYARENYVNMRFGKKFFSIYESCDIVGYTLNQKKTKVLRVFFNKYNRPEGDYVTETVRLPIKVGSPSDKVFSSNHIY